MYEGMERRYISYNKVSGGYLLTKLYSFHTSFRPEAELHLACAVIMSSGLVVVKPNYWWDGVSGVWDRDTNMRASLEHDVLYEFMRKGLLPYECWHLADMQYGRTLAEDGAWGITVAIDMAGLDFMKGHFAHPSKARKVRTSPKRVPR